MNYRPVIIVGAPRSGTNMLRDALTAVPGVSTWPCDEINYIWRHGNKRHPSDEFTPEMVTSDIRQYINHRFDRVASRHHAHTVVEKTCANSLRMAYVDSVVPKARYVVIRRDGIDAASSAMKRWNAPLDLVYVLRKARFIPVSDLPYYVFRQVSGTTRRLILRRTPPRYWGPICSGMKDVISKYTLPEICIFQWKRCVDLADKSMEVMDRNRIHEIEYRSFVQDPVVELGRITKFIGLNVPPEMLKKATSSVSMNSVGKGRKSLGEGEIRRMEALAHDTLQRHGYA